ncbi:carboxypeptidase-like regulatory domain-containing protein, partial [Kaarinaea lacus]
MKTILRSILFTLLFSGAIAYADNRGFLILVLQKGTGDPVDGATVVVIPTNDYATTGAAGEATLTEIEPGMQVKILAPGYETLVTTVQPDDGKVKFYIEPISVESVGMEVVAERLPEQISKITLSSEELAHTPGS